MLEIFHHYRHAEFCRISEIAPEVGASAVGDLISSASVVCRTDDGSMSKR